MNFKQFDDRLEYILAAPALIFLIGLVIAPMAWSLYTSFTDLNLIRGGSTDFIWLKNYIQLFQTERFWTSLGNTAYYIGIGLPIQFGLGLGIALLMANYVSGQKSSIIFTVLLLPMMMAPVISGYMWRLILHESFGPVNYLLGLAGLPQPGWFSSPSWALNSILIADIWQWTPFMILLLYTGRISINEELYEAAKIDGASRLFTFIHVTLPQMKGIIAVAVLLRAMDAFKFFDKMYVMTRGGPGISSELITYYNYVLGFRNFSMGEATALSWILLTIAVIIANLFLITIRRTQGGEDIA